MIRLKISTAYCCYLVLFFTAQAQHRIAGQVNDEYGVAIHDVRLLTLDTLLLGKTDKQGYFEIQIRSFPTPILLQKSGYQSRLIDINQPEFLDIQLFKSSRVISEVAVFGYNKSRTDYNKAFDIVDIDGTKLVNTFEPNPVNALRGRVPGMQMTATAGGVTSGTGIVIRGMKSIMGGNQPLFVIDGIPIENETSGANQYGGQDWGNSLKELNAYDISSIQVLKSVAAANQYGSRGMNGVVEITTKGANIAQGLTIETNVGASIGKSYSMPSLLNQETTQKINDPRLAWLAVASDNYLQSFESSNAQIANVAVNYFEGKNKIRLSYTADYNKGTYRSNTLDKNNLMLKVIREWSPKITTEVGAIYNQSISRNAPSIGAQKFASIGRSFMEYPVDFATVNESDPLEDETAWYLYGQQAKKTAQSMRAYVQSYWQLHPNWQWHVGGNYTDYNIDSRETANGFFERILGNESLYHQEKAYRNHAEEYTRDFMVKTAMQYHKTIRNQQVNASLSYDYWQTYGGLTGEAFMPKDANPYRFKNGDEKRIIDRFLAEDNFVSAAYFAIQNANQKSIHGAQFNVDYRYGESLFLHAAARLDQVKTLSNLDKLGKMTLFYPTIGLAYFYTDKLRSWFNLSEDLLSSAKIRANWGKSGNVTGLFHYQSAVTNDLELPYPSHKTLYKPYYTNSGSWGMRNYQTGFSYGDAVEMELGTNVSLFKNRIDLSVTWYTRLIDNYLYDIISPLDQYRKPLRQVYAQVRNRGWEMQVRAYPVSTASFTWVSTVNFAANRNVFTRMEASGQGEYALGASQNDVSLIGTINGSFGNMLSSYAHKKDAQGRLLLNAAMEYAPAGTATFIGNATPRWIAGVENGFTFKNFNLNTLLDIKYGGDIYSGTYALLFQRGVLANTAYGRSAELDGQERRTAVQLTDPESGEVTTVYRSAFDGIVPQGVFDQDVMLYGKAVGGMDFAQAQEAVGRDKNGEYLLQPLAASGYYAGFHDRAGVREEAVFKNSYVALREISLSYHLPEHVANKWLRSRHVQFGAVGRNLGYLFRSLPYGLNPDGAYNNRSAGAFEYASLLPVRTFGLFIKLNF